MPTPNYALFSKCFIQQTSIFCITRKKKKSAYRQEKRHTDKIVVLGAEITNLKLLIFGIDNTYLAIELYQ